MESVALVVKAVVTFESDKRVVGIGVVLIGEVGSDNGDCGAAVVVVVFPIVTGDSFLMVGEVAAALEPASNKKYSSRFQKGKNDEFQLQ